MNKIMKKKYISPQTFCHVLASVLPIAGSSLNPNATDPQTITVTNEEVDEFTSRRKSVWDDEEEEEF